MFKNRNLVIATKHKKESVIAPLFLAELKVSCFVPNDFDSDSLGTFTGEVERNEDPLSTARKKCLMAMEQTNCDLGIANEGSFGSHPTIFFANADDEILILIDKKNDLEIIARELSLETNFNSTEVHSFKELKEFAKKIEFPSHAIILKGEEKGLSHFLKGIQSWEILEESYYILLQNNSTIYAETDMRALYNPTRLFVIEKATIKLIEKIKSVCPECQTPGFGLVSVQSGLPCSLCGCATKSTKSHLYCCHKCNFEMEKMYPHTKKTEDPTYCDYCNP